MKNIFRENKKDFEFWDNGNPNFPPHIHDDIEIIFLKKGNGFAFCDDVTYQLKQGDFFLVFPNQIHHYSNFTPESECALLTINPTNFPTYSEILSENIPVSAQYAICEKDKNLIKIFHIAFEEYEKKADKSVIILLLLAFFGMLLERYEFSNINTNNSCALKIINYCKKHYRDELTVDTLSKELHISRSHISHTLNNKLKISFPDYVNSLRLTEAVKLLDNNMYSITEVSQLSGFQTIRNFNRIFKNHFGISPKEYRSQSISNNYPHLNIGKFTAVL